MDAERRLGNARKQEEYILALQVDDNFQVSVSFNDLDRHTIHILEFQDTKFLVNLEAILVQLLPEGFDTLGLRVLAVMPRQEQWQKKVESLLDLLELSWQVGDRQDMHRLCLERDRFEVLLQNSITYYLKKNKSFEKAIDLTVYASALFKIVEDETNHRVFHIQTMDIHTAMKLDMNALMALNIAPRKELVTKADKEKDLSLYGLLDTCKTRMGRKSLRRWLLQPLIDRQRIDQRLDLVEYLLMNEVFYNFISQAFLQKVCDLEKIAAQFFKVKQKKICSNSLSDVCKLYQVISMCKATAQFINDQVESDCGTFPLKGPHSFPDEEAPPRVSGSRPSDPGSPYKHRISLIQMGMTHCLGLFANYQETVERHVDLSRMERGEFIVKSSVIPEAAELLEKLAAKKADLRKAIEKIEKELGATVTTERDALGHYIIKAPKKVDSRVKFGSSSSSGFKVVSARANHVMLSSHELKSLSMDLVELEQEIKMLQESASSKIVDIVSCFYEAVEELSEFLGDLDALCSLAAFSKSTLEYKMVRPTFNAGDRLVLKACRHPILDRTFSVTTIPNDCVMERGKSSFHVITGPNMGGKSTFIRQVAINIILAQIGCFCCAEYADLPLFDSVVTRVGASDMQAKGLSTWMSELLEVSSMLESSTANSFLVIDELGRGTSTSEGIGMTRAIAEDIIDRLDSYCLFATHFFELVKLEQDRRQVKNFHAVAEVRDTGIAMSYKIKPSFTDKSLGLHVLSMMNFPQSIISFAKELSENMSNQDLMDEIEDKIERSARKSGGKSPIHKKKEPELTFEAKVQLIKQFKKQQSVAISSSKWQLPSEMDQLSEKLRKTMKSSIQNYLNNLLLH
jgi:DNA mismatch repair protein MSH2